MRSCHIQWNLFKAHIIDFQKGVRYREVSATRRYILMVNQHLVPQNGGCYGEVYAIKHVCCSEVPLQLHSYISWIVINATKVSPCQIPQVTIKESWTASPIKNICKGSCKINITLGLDRQILCRSKSSDLIHLRKSYSKTWQIPHLTISSNFELT